MTDGGTGGEGGWADGYYSYYYETSGIIQLN